MNGDESEKMSQRQGGGKSVKERTGEEAGGMRERGFFSFCCCYLVPVSCDVPLEGF